MKSKISAGLVLVVMLQAACTNSYETSTITADFRHKSGVYIVGYTDNQSARTEIETTLANDLRMNEIEAHKSIDDFANISTATADQLRVKANEKSVLAVIVLNRVSTDASDSVVQNPARVSPLHPSLQEFYAQSSLESADNFADSDAVFVEVNLFIIDGSEAKLYWSGTTWTNQGTDQSVAITDIAKTISDQLVNLRDSKRR